MPHDFVEALPKDSESGKYIVSLKYPELIPIMQRCKVDSTRQKMEFANSSKCMKQNTPILEQVILLRQGNQLIIIQINNVII